MRAVILLLTFIVLSEGVDVYSDWIDACDAVADESSAAPTRSRDTGYRGTMRSPKAQPAERNEQQYEDDFVVDDEHGMEEDYGKDEE